MYSGILPSFSEASVTLLDSVYAAPLQAGFVAPVHALSNLVTKNPSPFAATLSFLRQLLNPAPVHFSRSVLHVLVNQRLNSHGFAEDLKTFLAARGPFEVGMGHHKIERLSVSSFDRGDRRSLTLASDGLPSLRQLFQCENDDFAPPNHQALIGRMNAFLRFSSNRNSEIR
jgi:hypothetical protein